MKKHTKGGLGKTILKGLVVGGLILVALGGSPSVSQIMKLFGAQNSNERQRVNTAIRSLRKKRLVKISYEKDKEIIQITRGGRSRVLTYNIDDIKLKKPQKWDGHWRVVTFDIPNTKKKARDAINMKLKDLGFLPIQKSIFVSPYEAINEIDFIGEHFMVRKNIKYIIAKKIEGDSELKRRFGLR